MDNSYNFDIVTVSTVAVMMLAFTYISLKVISEWRVQKRISSKWVLLLILITLVARLPSAFLNSLINIDEAQTIAHALTLIRSPQPWKSIDFTTNGPLNAFVFMVPHWMGLRIDYLLSHIIQICLQAIIVWTLFVTVRNWQGRETALVTLIFILGFVSFAQHPDFIHHSSETWCVVFLSAALALFSKLTVDPSWRKTINWYWIGLLLGAVPFGKPQGAPPAIIASLFIIGYVMLVDKNRNRISHLGSLVLGGLTFSAVFVGATFLYNGFDDFYNLYIKANLHYAAEHAQGLGLIPTFIWTWGAKTEVMLTLTIAVLFTLAAVFSSKGKITTKQFWLLAMILAVMYGGAYAVERAGRPFNHYMLLFLFPGIFLLMGWGIGHLNGFGLRKELVIFCLVASMLLTAAHCRNHYQVLKEFVTAPEPWALKQSPLSEYVNQWIDPSEDYITVYGYYSELYVQTQTPAATRLVTAYQHSAIWPELYTPYYVLDLKKNKPALFIDAIDTPLDFRNEFVNRKHHAPMDHPEMSAFLRANYEFVKEIERAKIYVRKDRINHKRATK